MSSPQQPPLGKWQRRSMLAMLPTGALILVLWIVYVWFGGFRDTPLSWIQAVLAIGTALLQIAMGYGFRRQLGHR